MRLNMYIPVRTIKTQARIMTYKAVKFKWLVLVVILLGAVFYANRPTEKTEIISPVPEATPTPEPKWIKDGDARYREDICTKFSYFAITVNGEEKVICNESTPTPTPHGASIEGEASYYSRAGCLGCNEGRTMANGEVLSDEALTLALTPEEVSKGKRLNDTVTVQNTENGQIVKARVTDTGGFARHNRIADLSVATKNAIKCPSLCRVKIIFD